MPRVMEIATPFDPKDLLFHTMQARDELGRLSEYHLTLLSLKNDLDLNKILGQLVSVKMVLPDDSIREFNGYVTRFAQGGTRGRYYGYLATVRPWFWFLSRTADCRIFQEMTVPDIVKKVFADHGMADFTLALSGSYRKWTYCVQYRETDLNFVSRLLEHEGIYYYFKNAGGRNTMVITDSYSGHEPFPQFADLPVATDSARVARPDVQYISSWEMSRQVQPGVFAQDDYDHEKPTLELMTTQPLPRPYTPSTYEVYDYPGGYIKKPEGQAYAAVRIEEFGAQFEAIKATTNARSIAVGHLLNVHGHPRADQNGEYLVMNAQYDLTYSDYEAMPDRGGAQVACVFSAMPSRQQFRAVRLTPKPFVQGPQTAVVVGPPGEEIFTDKYGRVKVQFHWDRYGKMNQDSSCWLRVSHPWAGKGWGAVATPRIGQEVIVDFLEGDPDQPIVTGRVYNGDNLPPFGFPAGAVVSGVKSDTHKGSGYNEMSFDDTAGKEKVTTHAQFDMNTTVEHDQTSTIHRHRTDRIDVDDSESVGGNQSLTVEKNRTKHVLANETINVDKNRSSTIGKSESVTVADARSTSIGKDDSLTVGKNLVVNAGDSISFTTGSASLMMKKDGTILIKGKDIQIEGSGTINVKASSDVVIKGSKIGMN